MSSPGDPTTSEPPRVMPPHYFLMAIGVMLLLAWVEPGSGLWGVALRWVGAGLFIAAFVVASLARRQFARAGTEIRPLHASSAFVTDGAFRFSRNPMYVSLFVGLAGLALMLDRVMPWLVIPPFVALIYYRFVRHEEVLMAEQFGQAYRDYQAQVRRWL